MRTFMLAALALVASCYAPTYEGLLCGEGAEPCPDGYACVGGMCRQDLEVCGDGVRHAPQEACDDGNLVTETKCPYGQPTCNMCNSSCTESLSLTGAFCGDRMIEPNIEACDDGNNLACGLCSADCLTRLSPAAAVGYLNGAGSLNSFNDGQTISLLDGVRSSYLGYEIDTNNQVTLPNIRVDLTTNPPVQALIATINSSAIMIDATDSGGGNVRLVNQIQSGKGNAPIQTTIPAPFMVVGMSGGAGGDCPMGTGCTANGDCASNACTGTTCQ